jgi:hypothetical protein
MKVHHLLVQTVIRSEGAGSLDGGACALGLGPWWVGGVSP